MTLASDVLNLISKRTHQTSYFAIDKRNLNVNKHVELRSKKYLPRLAPYTIAYDYLVSEYEWFTKKKLGQSARGMVIVDIKENFEKDISIITNFRRSKAPSAQKVKWLTEFTYAIESHKNPMIQISDVICFVTKKFMEVDKNYCKNWNIEAKETYRNLYCKVHDRLIRKELLNETGRYSDKYNYVLKQISVAPSRSFIKKKF